jgi:L-lactate utilization protein LutC
MKKQTFEEFLQDMHAELYNGTDDDMPDAFEKWLSELDSDAYISWGTIYGRGQYLAGKEEILNNK